MSVAATTGAIGGIARRQRTRGAVPRSAGAEVACREDVPTLEDVLTGAWEDLAVRGRARCLVCGGSLHAADAGASCDACGSSLG